MSAWPVVIASLVGGAATGVLALITKCRPTLAPWLGFLIAAIPFSFVCLLYTCASMDQRIQFATNTVLGGLIGLFYMLVMTAAMVQWPTPHGLKWIFFISTTILTLVVLGILCVQWKQKSGSDRYTI